MRFVESWTNSDQTMVFDLLSDDLQDWFGAMGADARPAAEHAFDRRSSAQNMAIEFSECLETETNDDGATTVACTGTVHEDLLRAFGEEPQPLEVTYVIADGKLVEAKDWVLSPLPSQDFMFDYFFANGIDELDAACSPGGSGVECGEIEVRLATEAAETWEG